MTILEVVVRAAPVLARHPENVHDLVALARVASHQRDLVVPVTPRHARIAANQRARDPVHRLRLARTTDHEESVLPDRLALQRLRRARRRIRVTVGPPQQVKLLADRRARPLRCVQLHKAPVRSAVARVRHFRDEYSHCRKGSLIPCLDLRDDVVFII